MDSPQIAARLERLPISWVHYRLLLIQGFGWLFDAMDVGIITFVLAVLAKDWTLRSDQIGIIGSAGLGGELPVVSSLLSEFIPRKHRGRFIVLLESFWAFGWLIAAVVAYVLIPSYGWRVAFVVGSFPAFYIWTIRRRLPESPRWYESK